jgi:hypothetical protein
MLSIKLKFVEFRLEKHDFNLYKERFMERKKNQKLSNFEKFFFKLQDFMISSSV